MNTFWKVALGFILGVATTFGVLYVKENTSTTNNSNQQISDEEEELRDRIKFQELKNLRPSFGDIDSDENGKRNDESFELTTKKVL